MMRFLEDLANRQRFGMRPGLESIRAILAALGNPERSVRAIHVAGTNGKGAVASMLDACLREDGLKIARYTSPHLVRLNERFFLDGAPVGDEWLDRIAARVSRVGETLDELPLTFFEALTAVAFSLYAEARVDYAVLETGLGGRLDATNVCSSELTVITKIGLDHCDWLGSTIEKIAAEKAGIIKPGVPIVLGNNSPEVRAVVEARARELGAPFFYAPDLAEDAEIPADFSLKGSFNRENARTVIAAHRVLRKGSLRGLAKVVWPGRFQRVGAFLVDGAHNPPAAKALAEALSESQAKNLALVFGACADKDVEEVLSLLKPFVEKGYAVRTNNPRSLAPDALAAKMNALGIPSEPVGTLAEALSRVEMSAKDDTSLRALVCGSLFLAGEALVALNAYPWEEPRFDPSERLKKG